jgi:hypothetical protein
MLTAIAVAGIILVLTIMPATLFYLITHDTGRHTDNRVRITVPDTASIGIDYVQMEAQQNREMQEASESNERIAFIYDMAFSPTLQEIWADVAEVDGLLNSGLLAYPEWGYTDFPHNPANRTCPEPGIKCACWDIAHILKGQGAAA